MLLLKMLLRYYQIKTKKKEINMKRLIKLSLLVLLVSNVNATMMPRKNNNSNSNQGLVRVNRELGIGKKQRQVKKLVLNHEGINNILECDDLATFKKVAWEKVYETKEEMLEQACVYGAPKIIVHLIKEGANVDGKDRFGLIKIRTPLHWAALHQKPKLVKVLIQIGAGVNEKDNLGGTPLCETLIEGDINSAKLLIEAGTNIDSKDDGNKDVIERGLEMMNTLEPFLTTERKEKISKVVNFIKSVKEKRERVNACLNESRRIP